MIQARILEQAESVIELLISQCADLESLLVLAKRETSAVEKGDFEELLKVIEERATFEQNLEVFQRQIEDLRESMGYKIDIMLRSSIVEHAAILVTQIKMQDEQTLPLLLSARDEASENLQLLSRSKKSINAYAKDQTKNSVACDTLF